MMYDIQSKNDLATGASLVLRIPGDETDMKALHTIIADKPDFILPFRHKWIDGQLELIYQIGPRCKLQHLSGNRSPKEYSALWAGLLRPLLECGDWFMKPFSFVMDAAYLYCGKGGSTISYVYIPSLRDCSDCGALNAMAREVSRLVTVADANLENKVLRAIMEDYSPNDFMSMLKTYVNDSVCQLPEHCTPPIGPSPQSAAQRGSVTPPAHLTPPLQTQPSLQPQPLLQPQSLPRNAPAISGIIDDVFPLPMFEDVEVGKQKGFGAIFGKRKEVHQETPPRTPPVQTVEFKPVYPAEPIYVPEEEIDDDTDHLIETAGTARFRFAGTGLLPAIIDVSIMNGNIFTIGRYDVTVGEQQSDFEFDKMTKAVSRRHAVIECVTDVFNIIDLASSAGTFLNGQKLPQNTPFALEHGCRISFGNAGADYIWENI